MTKNRTVELANVVINFGDKGLVESLKGNVLPVIKNESLPGRGEVREYRFLGIKVGEITGNMLPVLYGRIVKIMTIEAEQELDEKTVELVQSSKQIPSAPSSFFVINLVNHRMAYLGETKRSPTLRDFEYCISRLLRKDHMRRFNKRRSEILVEEDRQRIPKGKRTEYRQRILIDVPVPDIRVTPLPAQQEIDKKMKAFALLQTITVKPMKTNNELPDENAEFLKKYAEQQTRVGASSSKLELKNGKDGLRKAEAEKLVKAASDGNYKVTMTGTASNGNQISGDLDQLSIKLKERIPDRESDTERASRLLGKMNEAFDAGYVFASKLTNDLLSKARDVIRSINGGQ